MKTVPRADRADVLGVQRLPRRDVLHHKERTAIASFQFLGFGEMIAAASQCLFHDPYIPDHLCKFFRLHRESAVRPAVGASQRQMLFHHFHPQGHGGGGDDRAHGMVGNASETVVGISQGRDHI